MINLDKFFEKFPQLLPNEEGLVNLNLFNLQTEIEIDGVFFDKYFIPYSVFFEKFRGFWPLPAYFSGINAVAVFVRLDFDKMILKRDHLQAGGAPLYGLPNFNLDQLSKITSPTLSVKVRLNPKFDSYFNNKIIRTEFLYEPRNLGLQIEEIQENVEDGTHVHRYFHSTFNFTDGTISHFDGKFLFYSDSQKLLRMNTTLDKHLRLAEKEVKLFRIDGSIRLKDWIEITILWFHKNELVLEWLDPKQYTEEYKDILNPEIDGEYKM